jgi:uncharacterized protein (DUF983 family)
VQGRLSNEFVSVEIETKCAHCGQGMLFTIDSTMKVSVCEANANPLVFMPDMDWNNFAEQTIIDSY